MELDNDVWRKIFKLRDNFVYETKKRRLYNYQKKLSNKLLQSVFLNEGKTLAAEYCRQSGKTTIITDTVVFLILFYFQICKKFNIDNMGFFNVGFFAPQQQQARTAFDMVRDYLKSCSEMGFDYKFQEFNADTINIRSKNYPPRMVYCFTAAPTSNPESKTLHLIIYDESQDLVDKQIDKAISPMGAQTNATEVFIGVAGYKRCKFWHHIEELPKDQKIIIPVDMALKERQDRFDKDGNVMHLNYQKHIDKKLNEIQEDSDEYKTQYLMEWILERGQFITFEALMRLESEYIIKKEYTRIETLYGGIDWGKMSDSTVFTIIDENGNIIAWYEFMGDDYSSQIEEISYLISKYYLGLKVIHCDSTGTQDMAVDILSAKLRQYRLQAQVIGVNFSSRKDEMYKNLSRLMHPIIKDGKVVEDAKVKFPKMTPDITDENITRFRIEKEKFLKQFLDLQKEIKQRGRWDVHAPEGALYHDDYNDSIGLACLAFRQVTAYKPMIG